MNKKAQALIICLWILVILTIFAVSIGHRVSMSLRLSRYQRDRLKAIYLAKAGVDRAIVEIREDETEDYDSLIDGWANNEEAFANILLSDDEAEFANVGYSLAIEEEGEETVFGVIDDERKININRIDTLGRLQLIHIFALLDLDPLEASDLADTMVEWISDTVEPELGKQVFKNSELKVPEELLLVLEYFYKNKNVEDYRGKAKEVYCKAKDTITAFGEKLNINTASVEAIKSLTYAAVDNIGAGATYLHADSLVSGIDNARNGEDNILATSDDLPFENASTIENFKTTLPLEEQAILEEIINELTVKSSYFRIEAIGNSRQVSKEVHAIYNRDQDKVIYWHEN